MVPAPICPYCGGTTKTVAADGTASCANPWCDGPERCALCDQPVTTADLVYVIRIGGPGDSRPAHPECVIQVLESIQWVGPNGGI